jgi:hypothetical protein
MCQVDDPQLGVPLVEAKVFALCIEDFRLRDRSTEELAVKRSHFPRVGRLRLRPRPLVTLRIAFAQRIPKLRWVARESDAFDAVRRVALDKPLKIFVLDPRDPCSWRRLCGLEGGIGALAMRARSPSEILARDRAGQLANRRLIGAR